MANEDSNRQLMIHIGVEVAVATALAVWITKRTGDLQNRIDELTARLDERDKIIEAQGRLLMAHEEFLTGNAQPKALTTRPSKPPLREPSSTPKTKGILKTSAKAVETVEEAVEEVMSETVDEVLERELSEIRSREEEDETIVLDDVSDTEQETNINSESEVSKTKGQKKVTWSD